MFSADSSELKNRIYAYLGYHGAERSESTDSLIDESLEEVKKLSRFVYRYEYFDAPPSFLSKEPYLSYLAGSTGVIVSVTTIGLDIDRRIKLLSTTDAARSVVLDSCASAYLEERADEFERALPYSLAPRFCPGYGDSDVSDIRYIFDLLRPEKFGITLGANNYMLPSKSMAGIVAVNGAANMQCKGCILEKDCRRKKEGKKCFSEKR